MRVTLKVSLDIDPRWFRSAVPVAGVPGRAGEAREQLGALVADQVKDALFGCSASRDGGWFGFKVEGVSSGNRARRVLLTKQGQKEGSL